MTPDPQGKLIHPVDKDKLEVDALRRFADELAGLQREASRARQEAQEQGTVSWQELKKELGL